jgi:hypothetical protein
MSFKIMYVTPKEPFLSVNNSSSDKASKIMYVTPKKPVLPVNDSDSDKGLFSSENVTEDGSRSSEETLIN